MAAPDALTASISAHRRVCLGMEKSHLVLIVALGLPGSLLHAKPAYRHLAHDVELDPTNALVHGRAVVLVEAVGAALTQFGVYMDRGLTFQSWSSNGAPVTVSQLIYQTFRYANVTINPPLPAGAQLTVTLEYGGTLECPGTTTSAPCDVGPGVVTARLTPGSAFIIPVTEPGELPLFPSSFTLRTPAGMQVVAGATRVSDVITDGVRVTLWDDPQPTWVGTTVFVGQLEQTVLRDSAPRITLHHAPGDNNWDARVVGMPDRMVPFVEAQAGMALPFADIAWVKLAPFHRETGYTTTAMVNLSNWHSAHTDTVFEEELAHEMAHLFYGVTVVPKDLSLGRVLTEGLVVVVAWDYAAARLELTGLSRERYLGRRLREAETLLRSGVGTVVQRPVLSATPVGQTAQELWTWAYAKGPAALDYLRVTVGEPAYVEGLHAYTAACLYHPCDVEDFKDAMENAAGVDLTPFFSQFFYGSAYPQLRVGVDVLTGSSGQQVVVDLAQVTAGPTPVQLWVEYLDGTVDTHAVTLTGTSSSFTFPAAREVRAVRPNPRTEPFLWGRSAVPADVNYDGRVDGADVLACAFSFGRNPKNTAVPGGETVFGLDLDFDPRCDLDGNRAVDEADLTTLMDSVGGGRP